LIVALIWGAGAGDAWAAATVGVGSAGSQAGAAPVQLAIIALGLAVLAVLWAADVIRPGSFRRRGGRDVGDLPWGVWLIAGGLVLASGMVAGGLLLSLPAFGGAATGSLRQQSVLNLVVMGVNLAVGGTLVYLIESQVPRSAGLRPRWSDVPIGLGAFLAAAPVILAASVVTPLVHRAVTGESPDPVGHETLRVIVDNPENPWVWGLILAAVVLAPIAEEITYRVFVQSALLRLTGSHWAAVIMTSLGFTAMHAGQVPLYAMPVLLALALAMGIAYERTGRLGVPIVMHVAFNGANIALAMLQPTR